MSRIKVEDLVQSTESNETTKQPEQTEASKRRDLSSLRDDAKAKLPGVRG